MQDEIALLEEWIAQRKSNLAKFGEERENPKAKRARYNSQMAEIESKKKQSSLKLLEIGPVPVKFHEKLSTVEVALSQFVSEEQRNLKIWQSWNRK